jgi:hypothetical protein
MQMSGKRTWKLRGVLGNVKATMASARSLTAAGKVLNLHRSTLSRLVKAGKIPPPGGRRRPVVSNPAHLPRSQTPAEWAADIRARYELTATEAALLTLAEAAYMLAQDPTQKPHIQISAAGRFQRLVVQLDLEEQPDGKATTTGTPGARSWPRRVI